MHHRTTCFWIFSCWTRRQIVSRLLAGEGGVAESRVTWHETLQDGSNEMKKCVTFIHHWQIPNLSSSGLPSLPPLREQH